MLELDITVPELALRVDEGDLTARVAAEQAKLIAARVPRDTGALASSIQSTRLADGSAAVVAVGSHGNGLTNAQLLGILSARGRTQLTAPDEARARATADRELGAQTSDGRAPLEGR